VYVQFHLLRMEIEAVVACDCVGCRLTA